MPTLAFLATASRQDSWFSCERDLQGSRRGSGFFPLIGLIACACGELDADEPRSSADTDRGRSNQGAATSRCGNCAVEQGEHCDDCNTGSGDGCSPSCRLEADCGDLVTCCNNVVCVQTDCVAGPANVCNRGTLESIMRNGDGACAETLALLNSPECFP